MRRVEGAESRKYEHILRRRRKNGNKKKEKKEEAENRKL